jgi:hypothetical protein
MLVDFLTDTLKITSLALIVFLVVGFAEIVTVAVQLSVE